MAIFLRQRCLQFTALALAVAAQTIPTFAAQEQQGDRQGSIFAYALVIGVAFAIVVGFATIRSALLGSTWSLSDAVSEEADVTLLDKDGRPIPGPDGKPQTITELRASSSRFIALIGLIAILMMYLGVGLIVLKDFALGNALPTEEQFKTISTFLIAGVTMFAPYIVNKLSSTFDWLTPKKN